jgi:hypothetical protein
MAEGFSAGDPFEPLEGKDGFHVVQFEFGGTLTLSCVAYGRGEMINLHPSAKPENASVEIVEIENPTPAQYGAVERLRLVLDAVARYLTTGGSWSELDAATRKMEEVAIGGLVFPGYHLMQSYSTTEGTYQHIFVKNDGSGDAALWEEPEYNESGGVVGGWISPTTLEQIREEQEDDATIWGAAARYAGVVHAEDHQADLLQLLPGRGHEAPAGPAGGAGVRVPGEGAEGGVVHPVPGTGAGDAAGDDRPANP